MPSTRRHRRSSRRVGAGYLQDQQWFDPAHLPPTSLWPALTTAPTSTMVRPVLPATFQSPLLSGQSGGRRTRRFRGGFSPSVMGGFIANAQAAIVPLALYAVYHTMVPKKGSVAQALGGFLKKSRRRGHKGGRRNTRRRN